MDSILIKNVRIVNEGKIFEGDVFIKEGLIHTIGKGLNMVADRTIDAEDKYLIPGVIDDQVHFREPGLTHKADIATESRAAVAGGVTSYMEMPNTNPPTLTQELLEWKYQRAAETSFANYSFFMGASNDNLFEVVRTDPTLVCGVKIFMGSSTGNMLVDNDEVLEAIFANVPMLIATHCEDEEIIKRNLENYKRRYGDDIPVKFHQEIRSEEACWESSVKAVDLAEKHGSRLHVLHISTAKELSLFRNDIPLEKKKITAEVCIHHLWFDRTFYHDRGSLIKWNPSVKQPEDRKALFEAMLDNRLDIIATDHAPHTLEEKSQPYTKCPSGGPLVQHSLVAMWEFHHRGKISIEKIVDKMCHAPAICFKVEKRGFIREGYYADLVLVNDYSPWVVEKENILYKCGWSPFESYTFNSEIFATLVNGQIVYMNGEFDENVRGMRMKFKGI